MTALQSDIYEKAGNRRRIVLLALTIIPSLAATAGMYILLPAKSGIILNTIITALFGMLLSWVSVGFWSSVAGFGVILYRYSHIKASLDCPANLSLPSDVRTALLFPIYNEDAYTVAEGIRTILQSLRAIGKEQNFDIFILSDSTNPEIWIQEEEAWYSLCTEERAFGCIYYRRRKSNLKRKSGNIADFCRRWGTNYKYMIVFDADSLMSGSTLVRLVLSMEAYPDIGILQTPPKAIRSTSLIARVQQFANHLYGPVFAAGLHYWQLGDAQYWGHNAIVRVEPFMRHCQLPTLPGRAPLGGEILSHDFVESALMRRAGYGVWLSYNMDGSFEQTPPTLIDELVRDRRWCQGNLQHMRLIFTRGFFPTHRALFINGILSYGSALMWLLFLLASSTQAVTELFIQPIYFPEGPSLFPAWPTYFSKLALGLVGGTASLLFIPKVLAWLLVLIKSNTKDFGGVVSLTLSVMAEITISTFLAPVRMLFHSLYVIITLSGYKVNWNPQNREGGGTTWLEALRFHWWGTALGLAWGWIIYLANPGFFLWLSPIVIGLALSVPLSVLTSKSGLGEKARRWRLFLTPPDTNPSWEVSFMAGNLARPVPDCPFRLPRDKGFVRAVVIPWLFALHLTLASHKRRNSPIKNARLRSLVKKALAFGPGVLSTAEKSAILGDPDSLQELHYRVWELDSREARLWGIT